LLDHELLVLRLLLTMGGVLRTKRLVLVWPHWLAAQLLHIRIPVGIAPHHTQVPQAAQGMRTLHPARAAMLHDHKRAENTAIQCSVKTYAEMVSNVNKFMKKLFDRRAT
jgi:hypothetical protein